ncbi:hypothetical protein MUP77_03685 [Candidatus Bathyarchaeota archaeon]|nr:hypothetical protein [Candidatus Bathyarchaeota archaeon]
MQRMKIVSVLAVLSLFCFAIIPIQSAMANPVVWQDGFESQDFSVWSWTTVSPGCLLETTSLNPHQGMWAAQAITSLSGDFAYSAMNFSGYGPVITVDPLYVRAYFYLDELNLADDMWIELVNVIGGPVGADAYMYSTSVRVVNDLGTLRWSLATVESNLTTYAYGAHTVQTGRYYCVETLRDVVRGIQVLWIDGLLEVSTATAMSHPSWEVKAGLCWVGSATQTAVTCELHYDDVAVSNYRIPQTSIFNVMVDGNSYPVSIFSNSSISDFSFNQSERTISFSVSGEAGTAGFCNVTFPVQLLGGPYVGLIDGLQESGTVTSNATHTSVYFTYSQSSHSVDIVGTIVAPEFPTMVASMLVLSAMTLMLLLAKRRLMHV